MTEKQLRTFSDETTTGSIDPRARGPGRATLAARIDDDDDPTWVARLSKDHLKLNCEPKSDIVLAAMSQRPDVDQFVRHHAGCSTIAIVDLAEHLRDYIRGITETFKIPFELDVVTLLRASNPTRRFATQILEFARDNAVATTALGRVEVLFSTTVSTALAPQGTAGQLLFDRQALREMTEREFQELAARFALAFADAMDPERVGKAVAKQMEERGFLTPGVLAEVNFGESVSAEHIFDYGSQSAFKKLHRAHANIVATIQRLRQEHLGRTMRVDGVVRQEESKRFLGLQAADIAAGLASDIYQRTPGESHDKARAVHSSFRRVLLNGEWIR